MSTRLTVRLVIACIALVIFLIVKMINPTRVSFSPANMSVDPGKGWKEVKVPASLAVCTPLLTGSSGIINASLMDQELTSAKAAAEKLRVNLVAADKAPMDAFKLEEFSTAAGEPAVHLSYTGKSAKGDKQVRSHHYITRNMRGRCVNISYVTTPELESTNILASIPRTLRVE